MARPRLAFRDTRITQGALWLLFAEVGVSLVWMFLDEGGRAALGSWLLASSRGVWHQGKIWTLVTSPFLQPALFPLLFHGLMLWLFVPALERWWGRNRFLKFALWTSLTGTVVGTAVGTVVPGNWVISGLDPFIFASIIAYGVLYADQQVQLFGVLPMTGRQLMLGMTGFVFIFVLLARQWPIAASWAASMGLAWLLATGRWTPRLWWLRAKQRSKQTRGRKHLKLVKDEDKKKWMN